MPVTAQVYKFHSPVTVPPRSRLSTPIFSARTPPSHRIWSTACSSPVQWLRCTKDEARYWESIGYDTFDTVGQKNSLKPALVYGSQQDVDPNSASRSQMEEVANAERTLEAAGISAIRDERLMTGGSLRVPVKGQFAHDSQVLTSSSHPVMSSTSRRQGTPKHLPRIGKGDA
ncbi:hypothetical protein BU25DRAFT_416942 [Macroventuria anomochaeta]|uniref:Uncharacterized protein n=1 Tax=Macroventuria anomochaeta TaxID=301207 RepID=A0ACB6SJT7_9PLEO|nr:uncharacterized protein BU25DRAFT_416942 [Macroventuria anomochaeta]KAF2633789.1 hypothetical protein BU25DRAFT_416942 [Macroventuria anomochaeta]